MSELAVAFVGKAQTQSHLKRLQRFFSTFELDYLILAQLVAAWMAVPQPWTLSLFPHHLGVWGLLPQYPDAGSGSQRRGLSPVLVDARQTGQLQHL